MNGIWEPGFEIVSLDADMALMTPKSPSGQNLILQACELFRRESLQMKVHGFVLKKPNSVVGKQSIRDWW